MAGHDGSGGGHGAPRRRVDHGVRRSDVRQSDVQLTGLESGDDGRDDGRPSHRREGGGGLHAERVPAGVGHGSYSMATGSGYFGACRGAVSTVSMVSAVSAVSP